MQTDLEKRQPAKNAARFYRMVVMPNLFWRMAALSEIGPLPEAAGK